MALLFLILLLVPTVAESYNDTHEPTCPLTNPHAEALFVAVKGTSLIFLRLLRLKQQQRGEHMKKKTSGFAWACLTLPDRKAI